MDRGCPARDTVSSLGALQATVVARPLLAMHGPSKPLPTLATASEATKRSPLSNPPESLVDTTPVSGEALRVSAAVCTEGKAFHVSLFSPLIISVTHFFCFHHSANLLLKLSFQVGFKRMSHPCKCFP